MGINETLSLDSQSYSIELLPNEMALVYSKTQADSLPLISMEIATQRPCYLPGEFHIKSHAYPTENSRRKIIGEKRIATKSGKTTKVRIEYFYYEGCT